MRWVRITSQCVLVVSVLVGGGTGPATGQQTPGPWADNSKAAITELVVLLAAGDDAPTPEGLVADVNARGGLEAAFYEGNPQQARLALTHRTQGEALERLLADPDAARARLERYVVLSYSPGTDLDTVMAKLAQQPHVLHVEKNLHFSLSATPDDPYFPISPVGPVDPASGQWGSRAMNLPGAWDYVKGNAYVGLIDIGIQVNHPDLRAFPTFSEDATGQVCTYGNGTFEGGNFRPQFSWDFTDNDCNPDTRDPIVPPTGNAGHGTHVAGIVAATTNNSIGVAGACWNCNLMMAKAALRGNGLTVELVLSTAADALTYLVDRGAQITSMSWGLADLTCAGAQNELGMMCQALAFAEERDVVMTAAPGNDKLPIEFPASDSRVMSVGGVDAYGAFWDRANDEGCPCTGSNPPSICSTIPTWECGSNFTLGTVDTPENQDLVGPAKTIMSTLYEGFDWCQESGPLAGSGYGLCTGTSMSAPYVAGVVGLLRSVNPLLPKADIRAALITHTDRTSWDPQFGWGLPDGAAAVEDVLGTSGGELLPNRLTPLFELYSGTAEAHLATTIPQQASAAIWDAQVGYWPVLSSPTVGGYSSFPMSPCVVGPCPVPRASVYVFSTYAAPFPGAPALVPLYRMSFDAAYGGNPQNRSFFYTTETTGIQFGKNIGYELDGIEGYIYPRCTPEPGCIPSGAVRLYRLYSFDRDDYAIFPESQLASYQADGYVSQASLNDWIGYVYPNVDSDGDHVIDAFETLAGTDPSLTDGDCDGLSDGTELLNYPYSDPLDGSCSVVVGEVGRVTNLNDQLKTVLLSRSYNNPVVIAQPPSQQGMDPSVVRITDVQSDRFTFYVHEAPDRDGPHASLTVSYIVLEAGSWLLDDGAQLRVGKVTTSATVGYSVSNVWATVGYGGTFPSAPLVFSQVQTNWNPHWVKTRQNNVGTSAFDVALEEEEASTVSHGNEVVGWVAITPGSGSWSGHSYVAEGTGNIVTHNWQPITFSTSVAGSPLHLIACNTSPYPVSPSRSSRCMLAAHKEVAAWSSRSQNFVDSWKPSSEA